MSQVMKKGSGGEHEVCRTHRFAGRQAPPGRRALWVRLNGTADARRSPKPHAMDAASCRELLKHYGLGVYWFILVVL